MAEQADTPTEPSTDKFIWPAWPPMNPNITHNTTFRQGVMYATTSLRESLEHPCTPPNLYKFASYFTILSPMVEAGILARCSTKDFQATKGNTSQLASFHAGVILTIDMLYDRVDEEMLEEGFVELLEDFEASVHHDFVRLSELAKGRESAEEAGEVVRLAERTEGRKTEWCECYEEKHHDVGCDE